MNVQLQSKHNDELQTVRLRLLALSAPQLQLLQDSPASLERELGFLISRDVLTPTAQRAVRIKLARMAGAPTECHNWFTYWLIIIRHWEYLGGPFGAGLAGFKGWPNESGESEIGYGIDPACQGRGYTSEAVGALLVWAFSEPTCRAVTALRTRRNNHASLRILEKAGFYIFASDEETLDLRLDRSAQKI